MDNGSRFLPELRQALVKHDVETVSFQEVKGGDFDAAILSGGSQVSWKDAPLVFKKELEWIQRSSLPMLGICLGFELICHAFGEELIRLPEKRKGLYGVRMVLEDPLFMDIQRLEGFESHKLAVKKLRHLVPLAISDDGVEVARHPDRLMYGFQFHPEKDPVAGHKLLDNFLKLVRNQ